MYFLTIFIDFISFLQVELVASAKNFDSLIFELNYLSFKHLSVGLEQIHKVTHSLFNSFRIELLVFFRTEINVVDQI